MPAPDPGTTAAAARPTVPWHCVENKCNVKVDPSNPFYDKVVKTHLKTHIPSGTDSGGKKDRGDWGAMEKWPVNTYPVGSMMSANFDRFMKLVSVILEDYVGDERNSSKVKNKVLQKWRPSV